MLSGNVRDLQVRAAGGSLVTAPMADVVADIFARADYGVVLRFVPEVGVDVQWAAPGVNPATVMAELGVVANSVGPTAATLDTLASLIERLARRQGQPGALMIDFASRLVVRSDALSEVENRLFTRALIASLTAVPVPSGPTGVARYNSIVLGGRSGR